MKNSYPGRRTSLVGGHEGLLDSASSRKEVLAGSIARGMTVAMTVSTLFETLTTSMMKLGVNSRLLWRSVCDGW